ncbi:hypothetical protein [Comamonas resistens]|uniref:Transposase n=1 Tax=Comamonas resistens TaxID=3046670 RepID=A0ABY8SYB6_9BURK|nr:hypothetical protein [Comamonas resistens]MDL5037866.1 hypothetical protein [Comamonas resistens]WHS67681.1 hypothetical protein QMY55_11440 [Comamonas resistens]
MSTAAPNPEQEWPHDPERHRQQVLLPESYHVATLNNDDADLIDESVRALFKQAL